MLRPPLSAAAHAMLEAMLLNGGIAHSSHGIDQRRAWTVGNDYFHGRLGRELLKARRMARIGGEAGTVRGTDGRVIGHVFRLAVPK